LGLVQFRRLAAFLLGVLLAGSISMDETAAANLRTVDRYLSDPGIVSAGMIHDAGRDNIALLLRYAAGESNRWLTEEWEWIQLLVGICLILVLIFGSRPPKIPIGLCLLFLAMAMAERFFLTPNILRLGRIADFLPPDTKLPVRVDLGINNTAYLAVESVKVLSCFTMALLFIVRPMPDPQLFAREAELAEEALQPRRLKR